MKQIFIAIFLIGCSILSFSQEEYFYNENSDEFSQDKILKTNKLLKTADRSVDDYCIPVGMNCNDGDGLQGFALSNVDNLSSGCSENGYGDFTNLNIELAQGNNYTIQAFSGYSTNYLTIWIDFNDNDVFDNSELLIEGVELGVNEITEIPLNIPMNAVTGEHRLRATVVYQTTNPDPCEVYNYGECEDYITTIVSPDYKDAAVLSIAMEDAIPVGQVTPKAEVGHLGLQTGSFEVTMTDGQGYTSTKTVSGLDFGETEIVEFDTYDATTGTYTFEACTDFSGDVNPNNDCMSKNIIIESFDAGVTSINIGATAPAGEIIPSVKISNFTTVGGSGEVELIIGSYSSTKSFSSLEPNGFVWVEMDPWDATVGEHTLEGCFISGDANPDNDCTEQPVTVLEPEVRFNANETVVLTGLDLAT